MIDELEQMMIAYEALSEGLSDRSEELSERTKEDAEIRFYRAMAEPCLEPDVLLPRLARAVAEVMFDACLVFRVVEETGHIELASVYHPNRLVMQTLEQTYRDYPSGSEDGLISQVIRSGQPCFRPVWDVNAVHEAEGGESSSYVEVLASLQVHGFIVVPLVTGEGQVLGAISVFRHTTTASFDVRDLAFAQWIASHAAMQLDTVRLYQRLRSANVRLDRAVQARDEFISMASHELRTPLTTMKLQVHMLMHHLEGPARVLPGGALEEMDSGLHSLDIQIDRLNRLITQLLDVSMMDLGSPEPVLDTLNLSEVVQEVCARFELELARARCVLTVDVPESVPGRWDRDRLDQVLTNLLSNAIKYGAGEPVEVRLELVSDGKQAEQVRLTVRDHGGGIAPEDAERIFARFERLPRTQKIGGLGLGLWIVRRIVEMHNGHIWVESADGPGARFVMELPRGL